MKEGGLSVDNKRNKTKTKKKKFHYIQVPNSNENFAWGCVILNFF